MTQLDLEKLTFERAQEIVDGSAFEPSHDVIRQAGQPPAEALPELEMIAGEDEE